MNTLKRIGIRILGDLTEVSENELQTQGVTSKGILEIVNVLSDYSLTLKQSPDSLNKLVGELELSVRTVNCLKNAGIETIGELTRLSESDLLRIQNFGQKSLNELKDVLFESDLTFAHG